MTLTQVFLIGGGLIIYMIVGMILCGVMCDDTMEIKQNATLFVLLWPVVMIFGLFVVLLHVLPCAVAKRVFMFIKRSKEKKTWVRIKFPAKSQKH